MLITLFLLLQFNVYAQKNSIWHIGFELTTDYLSIFNGRDYIITSENNEGYIVDFNKKNYSFGVSTKYTIQKKISILSGILYANKDFTGTFDCRVCDALFFPEIIEQRFISFPIAVEYTFLTGKLKPSLKVGLKNNVETTNDLATLSKGYFLESFFGAAVYYVFLENWNIGIGYNYHYAVSGLYKAGVFNLNTNSFYLQINRTFK